jgi:hypothetical protein
LPPPPPPQLLSPSDTIVFEKEGPFSLRAHVFRCGPQAHRNQLTTADLLIADRLRLMQADAAILTI